MRKVQEVTEKHEKVITQKSTICNHGAVRYKLADALSGETGYTLTKNFKNAINRLPSSYSTRDYMAFFDNWGTVSRI